MFAARTLKAGTTVGLTGLAAGFLFVANDTVHAGDAMHPTHYPFDTYKATASFDHASLRRGFEVFTGVCASCHSISLVAFRDLVGVTHSEDEAKEIAQGYQFPDEPDKDGNTIVNGKRLMRPGKLTDKFPNPYENENMARGRNNGSLPPDLSLIIKARHGGPDYLFSLLTGYKEEDEIPAGFELLENMHFNPYFAGGAIGMTAPLYDGAVEYSDGTPATTSQMAKDVTHFLNWCAEPEMEARKRMGWKAVGLFMLSIPPALYAKRLVWAPIKTQKILRR